MSEGIATDAFQHDLGQGPEHSHQDVVERYDIILSAVTKLAACEGEREWGRA